MSHHIRNSLVAVKTFLDLAPVKLEEEKLSSTPCATPISGRIIARTSQGQVDKINDLLKDLWLVSEKAPFHFTDSIRLDEEISQAVDRLKPKLDAKNIQVQNDMPATLPAMLVDKPKFFRLFELLLKDELVSLPAGSRIIFTAQGVAGHGGQERGHRDRNADNGPGLPDEALRLMFDPFVARSDSPQEYGISLMACYFIVHHHGGKIDARHAEPHGTIFSIRLPINPNQLRPAKGTRISCKKCS